MATPEQAPVQSFQSDEEVADSISTLPDDVLAFESDEDEVAATPAEQEPAEEDEQPEEETEQKSEEDDGEGDSESGDDPIFEVPLPGGETAEVPLSELAASYSRLQDYKAKTAEVANARRALEQERLQELAKVQETQGQLRQTLEFYQSMNPVGDAPSPSMLDPNSMDYNPDKYHLDKANYDRRLGEYYRATQQLQQVNEQQKQIQQQQQQAIVTDEMNKLKEVWPEFYDETKASEVRSAFLDGLQQHYGIDPQTVSTVLDHRFYLMAKDALAFKGVKKDAPQVSARLKIKPKVVKPGTRTQSKPQAKQLAEARARLKRSGKEADAADAFGQLLENTGLL